MRNSKIIWLALATFGSMSVHASVIHVPGDQETIQGGIDAAARGDTVLVADGTYFGDGNRDLDFNGKAIAVRSENGPEQCVILCEGSAFEPHRGFYLHSGEEKDSVIQGFTIKNAYAAGETDLDKSGGGIFCLETSPTITDNIIIQNRVEGGGGGIFCCGMSSPRIVGNIISGNIADFSGGGILVHFYASPLILRNTISGNLSKVYGGAGICCKNTSSPKIVSNVITGNTAEDYGGGIRSSHCFSIIRNNVISGNQAKYYGGGIFYFFTDTLIGDNLIKENTALRNGGGIHCYQSSPPIKNNLIIYNTALGRGGAVYCRVSSSPSIMNNTITGNSVQDQGGGIDCTDRSHPVITNTIFWNDAPDEIGGTSSAPAVTYSDVKGGYPGDGNIDADPLFVNGLNGIFYLSQVHAGQPADSPCVEGGGPGSGPTIGTTRTDSLQDSGITDMGYHYPMAGNLVFGLGPGDDNPSKVRVCPAEPGGGYVYEFSAYGSPHHGVNIARWDGDGDGFDNILTGPGPGYVFGPHVRGFMEDGTPVSGMSFLAYGTHHYGIQVAAGDLDGDGSEEIITGPGPGMIFGPHVRAFSYVEKADPSVSPVPGVSFMAYGTRQWGVHVTCGDIDGDRYDEIITGPGPGPNFGPHIRGWEVDGGSVRAMAQVSFNAYGFRKYGVNVGCGDVDGDGYEEIITAPGPSGSFGAHIGGWNYDNAAIGPLAGFSFFSWPSSQVRYGALVSSGKDLDTDNTDELVVGAGPDPAAASLVKVFRYQGAGVVEWLSLQAFPSAWTYGAHVAAGRF